MLMNIFPTCCWGWSWRSWRPVEQPGWHWEPRWQPGSGEPSVSWCGASGATWWPSSGPASSPTWWGPRPGPSRERWTGWNCSRRSRSATLWKYKIISWTCTYINNKYHNIWDWKISEYTRVPTYSREYIIWSSKVINFPSQLRDILYPNYR